VRNHPKLTFNGTATWPPKWVEEGTGRHQQGEMGTLTNVSKVLPQYEIPDHIILKNAFGNGVWESQLRADDREFLASLYELLRSECIGKSFSEIGNMELP